jgi:diguanylate cyclase (GGDEF)-like protein
MIAPPAPPNERQRLATLRSLKILDTPAEERFDRITRVARRMFNVPIALVTLVDAERQWFKSKQGLESRETPRSVSFCGHTILKEEPMVIPDAQRDERFRDNPLVTDAPHIRFYAGYPLSAPDGSKLGSLCLIDRQPRQMSAEDLATLMTLGRIIESELVALNQSTNDALTGLSNLRGFLEIGRYLFAVAGRLGHVLQLLYLKVDRIGQFYEQFGAPEAERALVETAQALLSCFRDSDLVARVGSDEFCVLLSRATPPGDDPGLQRVEDLLHRLNSQRTQELRLTAQAATVLYAPARHGSLEEMLAEAERRVRHNAN